MKLIRMFDIICVGLAEVQSAGQLRLRAVTERGQHLAYLGRERGRHLLYLGRRYMRVLDEQARLDSRLDAIGADMAKLLGADMAKLLGADMAKLREEVGALRRSLPSELLLQYLIAEFKAEAIRQRIIVGRAAGALLPSVVDDPEWKAAWDLRMAALRALAASMGLEVPA
jgi:hypothetical protein